MGGLKGLIARLFQVLIQSDNIVYALYPITADEHTAGKAIPSKAVTKDWGAWTEVVNDGGAGADIATELWYAGFDVISFGDVLGLSSVAIGHTDGATPPVLVRQLDEAVWNKMTAADSDLMSSRVRLPYPIRVPAGGEISARSADVNGASKDTTIAILVATGL